MAERDGERQRERTRGGGGEGSVEGWVGAEGEAERDSDVRRGGERQGGDAFCVPSGRRALAWRAQAGKGKQAYIG